jgi:hypothetical protein
MLSESTKALANAATSDVTPAASEAAHAGHSRHWGPPPGTDFRNGTMGWTSGAAIGAGWYVSPLRIDARTGVIVGAVLFDAESDTILIVDDDAGVTGNVEEGEQGEAE